MTLFRSCYYNYCFFYYSWGPSGNVATTRFWLWNATSRYDFSPDGNLR